ncbi:hypothetical protein AVU38_gp137 [Ralstonia phage RSL2]|uniref:hypothetical protein n=1 Tax=Ralstonia phage RSL2 TaxID=1585840 RepID=UPI00054A7F09|nr:hypothetical protein AVU38_gp137 [Ralstonia phage RSL2]
MKTKEQKRLEARDRFRLRFAQEKQHWESAQPGGFLYKLTAESRGLIAAEDTKKAADEAFRRFQIHAEMDQDGNPLTREEVFKLKSVSYSGFRGTSSSEVYPDRFMSGQLEYSPCNNFI